MSFEPESHKLQSLKDEYYTYRSYLDSALISYYDYPTSFGTMWRIEDWVVMVDYVRSICRMHSLGPFASSTAP